jgi:mannose-6-phosphate isomerase
MTGTGATTLPAVSIVTELTGWMAEQSLPLWSGAGWDSATGGFIERLDREGRADLAAPRRVRVQARQIYSFAKAAKLGWYPQGRAIAQKGLDYLLQKAKAPDGRPGYVHTLSPDGSVLNPLRDTYDHAFVLLALSHLYDLDQDAQVLAEIHSLVGFLDASLRSPHGGLAEGLPATLPRRQNPQMHMFEAMLAAFEATHEPQFLTRAGELFGLFAANLYDQRRQVLGEYFEEDWSSIQPVCVEPGHQAEWVWLLKAFERLSGCPTARFRSGLLTSALRYRDPATDCLVDEGNVDGMITRPSRRCWPQTEIAKAWLAQAESGEAGAADEARQALQRLQRHYLDHPVRGGWYDQFDGEGRSMVDWIPASSLYHVLCAIAEAERVLAD